MAPKKTAAQKPMLDAREREILHAVVNSYITTAEPVGSRTVVKRFNMDISAATVRNVMSDLEDLGFLQQVHTSSGRVPTDNGYRYYVDHLMRIQELTLTERRRIEREFSQKMEDVDGLLRHTSHLLALASHQASIVEAPDATQTRVQRFELIPVGENRVAVLMVDNFGTVRSMIATMTGAVKTRQVEALNNFLNQNFMGAEIGSLADSVRIRLGEILEEQRDLAQHALEAFDMIPRRQEKRLFLEGAVQLFEQPEFQRVEQAREVFGLLEEHDKLITLLRKAVADGDGRAVFISKDDDKPGIEGIGVVASAYNVDGKPAGFIGVLGPRRMPYSRLTALVHYTADMVGRFLTRLGG
ncbi:MAG TPA: heat-inducible transcription repressor HrcA [Candidatus Hydrogenedentes bacterium]|nr:heat-inducible transcription repressor HrcA [Candidatus Hydrogenedentota bacterium]